LLTGHSQPVNDFVLKTYYPTDKAALWFLGLAMSYLLAGLLFGVAGSFQYLLPDFLKQQLSFQKSRPLHVYLVISWIFTGAQGIIYYCMPRVGNRKMYWGKGVWIHFFMQLLISTAVIVAFVLGYFGGREYLEFPPVFGLLIILSWIPFAINFFATVKPDYKNAPVYIWSWSVGIIFFFITMSESYLWMLDYFRDNMVRDVTVQWKALGSMVGSWNMLIYGSAIYIMEKMLGDEKIARSPVSFAFFFLGLTNLMFNWGHHTYIVPAAPYVKNIAYIISMTELLIFGQILYLWRRSMTRAQRNFHLLPFRLLSFADIWIFLNLALAIAISVPAINAYTHGTHITVAHAMGATIGINTMLLFGGIFFVLKKLKPEIYQFRKKLASRGAAITNIALIFFWISLIGSGIIKITSQLEHLPFARMIQRSAPMFKLFAVSGLFIMLGILMMVIAGMRGVMKRERTYTYEKNEEIEEPNSVAQ
jgi:nitric oxide reductase subunit B